MRVPRPTFAQVLSLVAVSSLLARPSDPRASLVAVIVSWAIAIVLPAIGLGLDPRRSLLVAATSAAILLVHSLVQAVPSRAVVAACLTIAGIARSARDVGDLWSAILAVGLGIAAGTSLLDPCTPMGLFFGPLVGLGARVVSRPPARPVEGKAGRIDW